MSQNRVSKIRIPNITARDVPTILGLNPYETAWQLLEKKVENKHKFFGNKFTDHGYKYEKTGLEMYSKITNNKIIPQGNKRHFIYNWLTGRPDAITENNCIVEIKCPYSKNKKTHYGKDIPKHYWAQCQVYMEMLDIEVCHYAELHIKPDSPVDGSQGELVYFAVCRNRKWWEKIIPVVSEFYKEMVNWIEQGSLEEHSVRKIEIEWGKKYNYNSY